MCEEIFGPVLTVFLYDSESWDDTLELVNTTSDYALTGCVMAEIKMPLRKQKIN